MRKDTPENIAKARQLRDAGMCMEHIARQLGIGSGYTIKRWLDPKTAEANRLMQRLTHKPRPAPTPNWLRTDRHRPTQADIQARLAEIPPDTRSITARIFGDPLPGRRALDRRPS